MKMCFVTASVSRKAGGLQEGVLRLAQGCGAENLSILGIEDEYAAADIERWRPLRIQTSRVVGPERFSFAPGLSRSLDEANVELAHLHGLWRYTSIAVAQWHRRTSKPYIVHPHGMLDGWAVRNSRWKKMMAAFLYERSMLNQAACIRALCQAEADSIRKFGCKNPICVIPNGMDLPEGPFGDPAWQGRLEPGSKVLLYLGRLHPKKGLVNLLKAWAEVRGAQAPERNGHRGSSAAKKWVLAIAGWGEGGHELELKHLADALGLQWAEMGQAGDAGPRAGTGVQKTAVIGPGGLIFLGPQFASAKANCYHHSDAFILPSLSEGLPMVILEAWSHGKLAVMTPQCNLPEGIAANAGIQIGINQAQIVPGLLRLFSLSQAERNEMGRQGLRLISERFSWEHISAELLAVSEWVLHGGATPESICRIKSSGVFLEAINTNGRKTTTAVPIEHEPEA